MTQQVPDNFFYNYDRCRLISKSAMLEFDPEKFGIETQSKSTACWRGYEATYRIEDNILRLTDLEICIRGKPVPIYGVAPKWAIPDEKNILYDCEYHEINHAVDYNGELLLGVKPKLIHTEHLIPDFMERYYYKNVYELTFLHGEVVRVKDRSKEFEVDIDEVKAEYADWASRYLRNNRPIFVLDVWEEPSEM